MTKISPNASLPKRGKIQNQSIKNSPFDQEVVGGFDPKIQIKRPSLPSGPVSRRPWGFTLFEIVLALLILAVAIVPMMNAFAPAILATGQGEEQAVLTGQARQTMNGLLEMDFATLDAKKAAPADLVTMLGDQAATGVIVSVTDAAAAGGAGGLLELTVTLKNVTLQSLKAAR